MDEKVTRNHLIARKAAMLTLLVPLVIYTFFFLLVNMPKALLALLGGIVAAAVLYATYKLIYNSLGGE